MTSRDGGQAVGDYSEATAFVLATVQRLDPSVTEEAVARFVQEIAEAQAALARLDLEGAPLEVGFSAAWSSDLKGAS
jgi:hypothetical protein